MGTRNLALAMGDPRDLRDRGDRHQHSGPDMAQVMRKNASDGRLIAAKKRIEQIKRDLNLSSDDIRSVHDLMLRDQAMRGSSPAARRMKP